MRKMLLNELRLELQLVVSAEARFLVAEARSQAAATSKKQTGKASEQGDETEQITVPMKQNGRPFLPGSSLKGVLRSQAERIAATLNSKVGVCHLFDRPAQNRLAPLPERLSCSDRFTIRQEAAESQGHSLATPVFFRESCPACQTFGHPFFAGRLRVSDFTAVNKPLSTIQTHVAIDRVTSGAAANKLYKVEYIHNTIFSGEIVLENFSLWQVGWLGFLLRDLDDGLLRIGHKVTSGSGVVTIGKMAARLCQLRSGRAASPQPISGIGDLFSLEKRNAYGCPEKDQLENYRPGWELEGPWQTLKIAGTQDVLAFCLSAAVHTSDRLRQFEFPGEMQIAYLENLRATSEVQS